MGRKEIYECNRCKAQIDIPRFADRRQPPPGEYLAGWKHMWLGPMDAPDGKCLTDSGTYCPACAADIEFVMTRTDVDLLTPATDEDIRNACRPPGESAISEGD